MVKHIERLSTIRFAHKQYEKKLKRYEKRLQAYNTKHGIDGSAEGEAPEQQRPNGGK